MDTESIELSWSSTCVRQNRVMLTLREGDHHAASVDMAPEEAVDLAQVLVHEMHGSCADVWLVERQADREHLWLTLSATSRGMVRISRIELDSQVACQVATSLLAAAADCRPVPTRPAQWRKSALKSLRTIARWAVQHTRPLTRQRQQWMNRVHRALVVLYRNLLKSSLA